MKRRTKTKFTQIHVSIPVRTLEDLDETLGFTESRSKKITNLVSNYLKSETEDLQEFSSVELLEHLQFRFSKDSSADVLIKSLLEILTK